MRGYPLEQVHQIMKPSKVDKRKESHVKKLEELMKSSTHTIEEKLDGIHVVIIGGQCFSTKESKVTGLPIEKTFHIPHIMKEFQREEFEGCIIEGEAFLPGKKVNDVTKILNVKDSEKAVKRQQEANEYVHLRIFDMVQFKGMDLIGHSWEERRALMHTVLPELINSAYTDVNPSFICSEVDTEKMLENILCAGGEGIVIKNLKDHYYPGKRPAWNWTKVKAELDDVDVFITGYELPTKEFTGKDAPKYFDEEGNPISKYYAMNWIGALKIGMYGPNGQVVDMGRVSGMPEIVRAEISKDREGYIGQVITIKAMERSPEGKFRHGSFKGIHPDKNAKDCLVEDLD